MRRVVAALTLAMTVALAPTLVAAPALAEGDDVGFPEIVVYLHDAGGDAIDYYDTIGAANIRFGMTEIARALGAEAEELTVTDYRDALEDFRTAGAQLEGKLARRRGSNLEWSFETGRLSRVMAELGYDSYLLAVCLPDVDHELVASVAAAEDEAGCEQWVVSVADGSIEVDLTMTPDTSEYRRIVMGMLAASAVGVVIAVLLAMVLRRTLLRTFGPAALVIATVGVLGALAPAFVAAIALAVVGGPVSSFVLAHDLGVGEQIATTVLPTAFLTVPGTVLAVLALRSPPAPDAGDHEARPPAPQPAAGGPGLPTWLDS